MATAGMWMLRRKGLEGSMAGVGMGNLFGDLVLAGGPQKEALDNLKKDYGITLRLYELVVGRR